MTTQQLNTFVSLLKGTGILKWRRLKHNISLGTKMLTSEILCICLDFDYREDPVPQLFSLSSYKLQMLGMWPSVTSEYCSCGGLVFNSRGHSRPLTTTSSSRGPMASDLFRSECLPTQPHIIEKEIQ